MGIRPTESKLFELDLYRALIIPMINSGSVAAAKCFEDYYLKDSIVFHRSNIDEIKSLLQGNRDRLVQFADHIRNLLRIAFITRRGEALPPELQAKIPDIEKQIFDAFTNDSGTSPYKWRKFGELGESLIVDKFEGIEVRLRMIIRVVSQDFATVLSNGSLLVGIGYEKIGMCPNCDIFFEKKRKDQEYCSSRCQQTAAVRRTRVKQKEP